MDLCVHAQSELLIESVLGNLLSNAVKFSPRRARGSPCTRRNGSGQTCGSCSVMRARGFRRRCWRCLGQEGAVPSRQGTAGEQGQGYGLQLAREHLKRMEGRLQLDNRAEGGLQAIIWLRSA